MMDDLQELYREVILDHSRRPRNYGPLPGSTHSAEGHNPVCGDRYSVHLRTDGDEISEVKFEGSGCAISKASASVMTTLVKGQTREQTRRMFEQFHRTVLSGTTDPEGPGKLAAFAGVHKFPERVKCAILPWHALKAALDKTTPKVSTEQDEGAS